MTKRTSIDVSIRDAIADDVGNAIRRALKTAIQQIDLPRGLILSEVRLVLEKTLSEGPSEVNRRSVYMESDQMSVNFSSVFSRHFEILFQELLPSRPTTRQSEWSRLHVRRSDGVTFCRGLALSQTVLVKALLLRHLQITEAEFSALGADAARVPTETLLGALEEQAEHLERSSEDNPFGPEDVSSTFQYLKKRLRKFDCQISNKSALPPFESIVIGTPNTGYLIDVLPWNVRYYDAPL